MLQIIIVTFKRYDTLRIFIFKRYVLLDNKNYEMQFVGLMKSLFMTRIFLIPFNSTKVLSPLLTIVRAAIKF